MTTNGCLACKAVANALGNELVTGNVAGAAHAPSAIHNKDIPAMSFCTKARRCINGFIWIHAP